ncbi:MAG: arginyltransferase [Gammaproteobacteria bacterium RIFCSPLOWO2_02_47_7]|nr:MAG: arginyltransferase [Gammaproteobacteria bacterium RIFCSPLOWO2_02_47_7]
MNLSVNKQAHKLCFYATPEHACMYLPGRQATTLFADPAFPMDRHIYTQLVAKGFRRSGEYIYRPWCNNCNACVPIRIPVQDHVMRKKHARVWKRNQDIKVITKPPVFEEPHFELYCRYINARHKGGGMDNPGRKDYMGFLGSNWMDTLFYEMKLADQLLAVSVVDQMDDGLSAVYTFYDTNFYKRSLGTFSILYEIHEAARLGLKWLYLGYWIKGCAKMNYKNQFSPAEFLQNNLWVRGD